MIKSQFILRSIRANDAGHYHLRVGGEFFMLEPRMRETLNRYIIEKQRADIRRIKRELE